MMQIDMQSLRDASVQSENRFFAGVDQDKLLKIDKILVDGVEASDIVFCDILCGYGIRVKRDVRGQVIAYDGDVYHEFFFGKIEVIYKDTLK